MSKLHVEDLVVLPSFVCAVRLVSTVDARLYRLITEMSVSGVCMGAHILRPRLHSDQITLPLSNVAQIECSP